MLDLRTTLSHTTAELRTATIRLRDTIKGWGASLIDWRPGLLVGICFVLMLLVAQLPFSYTIQVGQERGYLSDLPFLQNFNHGENSYTDRSFRWSRAESSIEVPGIGQRDVIVRMQVLSHRAQWQPDAPATVVNLDLGTGTTIPITLRPEEAFYTFYVPASALDNGTLRMHLTTEPWQSTADRRAELGIAIGRYLTIDSTTTQGFVPPDALLVVLWSLSLALFWLALRVMGFSRNLALWLLVPLAVLIPMLSLFDAPRLAFGSAWAIQAGLISIAAAALCAWFVPPLLRHLHALPPSSILQWLLLLMVLSFVLKYAGRLYPESMPGDLQLHVNRYILTVHGRFYIEAQHRGLPFPFPNGLYVMIAPLTLTGLGIHFLFELTAGLFEATMVILLYLIMARVVGSAWLGLLAATTYALTPAGFMTTWFAFETQVAALWFSTLLMLVLALRWPHYDWPTWWLLVFLFTQAFLGHIGQFINTVLLGMLVGPYLWWRFRGATERRGVQWILGAGLVAGLFAGLFYYSRFTGLFWEQLQGLVTDGLNDITGREPIPRSVTLHSLWQDGLITHFGFFPMLLALPGALVLSMKLRHSLLPPLIWFTFLVATSQAVLPLITLSSITTRWLMFSAWAICVAGAVGFALLWRHGHSARVVAVTIAGYVCWQTIIVWVDAMFLRDPPVEPF